jgi:hypothetical protein
LEQITVLDPSSDPEGPGPHLVLELCSLNSPKAYKTKVVVHNHHMLQDKDLLLNKLYITLSGNFVERQEQFTFFLIFRCAAQDSSNI